MLLDSEIVREVASAVAVLFVSWFYTYYGTINVKERSFENDPFENTLENTELSDSEDSGPPSPVIKICRRNFGMMKNQTL